MRAQIIDSYTREILDPEDVRAEASYHRDGDNFPAYVARFYTDPDDARDEVRRLRIRGQLWTRLAEYGAKKFAPGVTSTEGERSNHPATDQEES